MNNIFEKGFTEPEGRFPDAIFAESTQKFSTVTEGLAELRLIKVAGVERLAQSLLQDKMFRFKAVLISSYLPEYSFEIFEFGYDVALFPVAIELEEGIREELVVEPTMNSHFQDVYLVSCETEKDFEQQLQNIFSTERFKKTVGGLMKIARAKRPPSLFATSD